MALGRVAAMSLAAAMSIAACAGASQRYPLDASTPSTGVSGQLQVERIEGGQKLVIVELEALPPPEYLAQGVNEYVVWLEGEGGKRVRAGTLRYDKARRSGNLMATTALPSFTVRVTAEGAHEGAPDAASVLVAEQRVLKN